MPGPEIAAQYVATSAEVARSLGRPLSRHTPNVTVNLVRPRSMYADRVKQLDLRISKVLRFGRNRTTAGIDIYNALNSSSVLTLNNAFASWQQPQSILPARFAKVMLQYDFSSSRSNRSDRSRRSERSGRAHTITTPRPNDSDGPNNPHGPNDLN